MRNFYQKERSGSWSVYNTCARLQYKIQRRTVPIILILILMLGRAAASRAVDNDVHIIAMVITDQTL